MSYFPITMKNHIKLMEVLKAISTSMCCQQKCKSIAKELDMTPAKEQHNGFGAQLL
jgi:hypothetical protein